MLYSRWKPEGGFDYFETPERRNLGDDLPSPQLPSVAGGIGVPAQECGRQLPGGARKVGQGEIPQGLITAVSGGASGVSGLDAQFGGSTVSLATFGIGAFLGFYFYPWIKRQL